MERLQAVPSVPLVSSVAVEPDRLALPVPGADSTVSVDRSERLSPAVQKAVEWLQANPDRQGLPVREIADLIGVSHTIVVKARKRL